MKSIASLVFFAAIAAVSQTGLAQSRMVEPNQENAAPGYQYYSNLGQITDDTGGAHPEVLYYTEHGSPTVFLEQKKMHFVTYNYGNEFADDSTYRITMEFKCPFYGTETACGSIQAYEPGNDVLNYYNPYTAPGITGVSGYAGVVYQDAFMNTDFHFYSNSLGTKNFIRFKPTSDPDDFILKFTGQDSIAVVDSMLQAFVGQRIFTLPIIDAYQVDASNNVYPVSWMPNWVSHGNGEVGIILPGYDPTMDLVVRIGGTNVISYEGPNGNLDWATYYGGTESEYYPQVVSNANKELYHAMAKVGGDFPNRTGAAGTTNGNYLSGFDTYISKFDANANRIWGTYYGGTLHDMPNSIIETKDPDNSEGGFVFVGGTTNSENLVQNTNSGFNQTSYGGGCDGYLASFDKASGMLVYNTYFGGSDSDEIFALAADDNNARIYFGGKTKSSSTNTSCSTPGSASFSLCAGSGTRYYQSSLGGSSDGFIASLNTATNALTWSTYFGGSGWEHLQTIALSTANSSHAVYVGGTSRSNSVSGSSFPSPITAPSSAGTFPLADPGSGAYFQKTVVHATSAYDGEGFVARFDASGIL